VPQPKSVARRSLQPAEAGASLAVAPGPSDESRSGSLTICAIGYAESVHVTTRVRWFAERGHRVYLITESPSRSGIEGVTELVPGLDPLLARQFWFRAVLWLARKFGGRLFDDTWRAISFVRLLRRCRPDVVHIHFAYSYYGWLAGLLACRPLVVTVMGGDVLFEEQGSPTPVGKWLTLHLLRKADYITSKSHYLTQTIDRLAGVGSKTERIVWGIPVSKFGRTDTSALRCSLGLEPRRRVILSPKILQPLYRIHLVIEAMDIVRREIPEAVLVVTEYSPDPDYKEALAARVAELDLADHVLFCGRVDHADMPAYYSLAEMAVAVPSSDGLPQTLLESMACGTPNILSRLPRYEEIVGHEDSAYFVDANPEDIARGILRLFGAPDLCSKIAANAETIVRREGDLDEQAGRVERRYRELAATIKPGIGVFSTAVALCRLYRLRGMQTDAAAL
jgi:glycosyltransferase involved in cell wall biosynthesis